MITQEQFDDLRKKFEQFAADVKSGQDATAASNEADAKLATATADANQAKLVEAAADAQVVADEAILRAAFDALAPTPEPTP